MADVKIHTSWKKVIGEEFGKEYFEKLIQFVKKEYSSKTIYPEGKNIFRAFELCPFEEVKVVIIGQDPYHGPKQANGLCFSVNDGIPLPPSLQNIYKEIETDLGVARPTKGNLDNWARQGVLLLNATLTVRANTPGSHQHQGWEQFTDAVIRAISAKKENIVFLLWGKYAQDKGAKIDSKKHHILTAAHPSPFSAYGGFFGCKHFSKTNKYLKSIKKNPIEWIA